MKNVFTILLAMIIALPVFSQQRALVSKNLRDISIEMKSPVADLPGKAQTGIPSVKSAYFTPEETIVGGSRYDNQSNASDQNRLYLFNDGTIGATWTRSVEDGTWSDRGTGYNYFDGNNWGPAPTGQLETEKTGWPSYMPLGENGEMTIAHGSSGLVISKRDTKGTGDWTYSLRPGPTGHEYIIWNRTVTSGIDFNRIHCLATTASTVYSGTPFEGLNGAVVYSMSTDGGTFWDMENVVLDGMTSDDYVGFQGDTYAFAEPKGDIIAFVIGESWYDLFLMKSTDGGETFDKTLIWEHPYPFFDTENPIVTDTFYCADGANACAIDNTGKVHVVFGINRAISDGATTSWYPFVDGIGYWNEDMPAFSDNHHALDPYGHPESELVEDYNLIGWTQDVNGDGEITFVGTGTDNIGLYYVGLSSMPQLVIDQGNNLYLVFSSVTETYDNGIANYRHIWARASPDGGQTWLDFVDLTSGLIHIFDECVYPSCAANSDDYIYLEYQSDAEPGNALWGTTHPPTDNNIVFSKVPKPDIIGISENKEFINNNTVSQNYPNPFSGITTVYVELSQPVDLQIEVTNMTGQLLLNRSYRGHTGNNALEIDGSHLSKGIYFYTVKSGAASVTKKMIVE